MFTMSALQQALDTSHPYTFPRGKETRLREVTALEFCITHERESNLEAQGLFSLEFGEWQSLVPARPAHPPLREQSWSYPHNQSCALRFPPPVDARVNSGTTASITRQLNSREGKWEAM